MELPPFPGVIEPAAAAKLREVIGLAGYDGRIFQILGMAGPAGWKGSMRASLSRLPTPACGVLTRFFLIGDEVSQFMLEPALGGGEVLEALDRAKIAVQIGDGVWQCPYTLIPAADVLAFSDPIDDPGSESAPEAYILPVSRTSRYVDDLTVREPCELAIDLGCGQGFLALRSMTHAQRCIATDINPRAVAFARTNASLNSAGDRIECRLGSFFEPLQDVVGQVDLLTCNPPFIIMPEVHTTALASALEGDGMLEHLVRSTPGMLREHGWSSLIGLWEHPDPGDWISKVRGWLEGSGCDALMLQFRTYQPDEYFQQWFAPEVREANWAGWRSLCERRQIKAITFGGIVMHKRRGTNWLRSMYTLVNARTGSGAEQIRAYFHTQTVLETLANSGALLDRRMRMAAGWRFDPAQPLPRGVPPSLPGARLGLPLPLAYAASFEPILGAFDGGGTVRQTLQHLHQVGHVPMDPDHPAAGKMLWELAVQGCLDIVD
jgi:methylase of polypeptide subunit release factors